MGSLPSAASDEEGTTNADVCSASPLLDADGEEDAEPRCEVVSIGSRDPCSWCMPLSRELLAGRGESRAERDAEHRHPTPCVADMDPNLATAI